MRSKKAISNVITSIVLQIVIIISGFILPWLIINKYGSSVNGVIASITQFLGFFSIIEGGVAGVIRASLYKSIAKKDFITINNIIKSSKAFFRRIAFVFLIFLFSIAALYPYLMIEEFSKLYVFSLVIILGIKSLSQYLIGITYQIFLQSDQRMYINSSAHIITIILSTVVATILINQQVNIHLVQFISASIFVIKPLMINLYVKRKYKYILIQEDNDSKHVIKNKWDGIGHHISYFLLNRSGMVIVTFFTSIVEVSVYSIYMLVSTGLRSFVSTFSSGVEALFGDMLAKKERISLSLRFNVYETFFFMVVTVIFTSAGLLITSFISLYTNDVHDANYVRESLSLAVILAEASYCLRLPYHSLVMAAGHFKQTRNGALGEALTYIILSVIFVQFLGIVGVVIGSLLSTTLRTIQYVVYLSKNLLNRNVFIFLKKLIINTSSSVLIVLLVNVFMPLEPINLLQWFFTATMTTLFSLTITLLANAIFYPRDFIEIIEMLKRVIRVK